MAAYPIGYFGRGPFAPNIPLAYTHWPNSGPLSTDCGKTALSGLLGPVSGVTSHATTGALAASAATLSGSAVHPHLSTGALAAGAATLSGTAVHPHVATGALAAGPATISGTSGHFTLHSSVGALVSDPATIAGTGATIIHHDATGSLVASAATLLGFASDDSQQITVTKGWVGPAKKRRNREEEEAQAFKESKARLRQQIENIVDPKPAATDKTDETPAPKPKRAKKLAPAVLPVFDDRPLPALVPYSAPEAEDEEPIIAAALQTEQINRQQVAAAVSQLLQLLAPLLTDEE